MLHAIGSLWHQNMRVLDLPDWHMKTRLWRFGAIMIL